METDKRFRLPIASGGWQFILPLAVLTVVLFLVGWKVGGVVAAGATLLVLYFFRDPERKPPRIVGAIVSPADGRVTAIDEVEHGDFPNGRARRISIFLSLFNVHVNRSPVEARVVSVEYRPGRFRNAMSEASARENERNTIHLRNGFLGVYIDQIAGILARRVVCCCQRGDTVAQGQRIGLIRFGSRVDTFLPTEADVRVKRGMKVRGGETVLAILNPTPPDAAKRP
ncbi:hypothetical protein AMJ85_09980 [candidate division BRC1 bacterium SM23_51]|nr:MAG: hypothetical protein AMJ85_09980 [candidate division BRC1 bacterium SM23_51]